jgi:hypothetical protein
MALTLLGDHPFSRDSKGDLQSRVATLFVHDRTLVTLPGIHATQRLAFVDHVNERRQASGQQPLTDDEQTAAWEDSVDLILERDAILIRPDPSNMPLAFEADELLQTLDRVSKRQIKFLYLWESKVRQAIRQRGEYWRIAALPKSPAEITRMIRDSRLRLVGPCTYHYNRVTGSKLITYHEFAKLRELEPLALARQMREIADLANQKNRLGQAEIRFFMANGTLPNELAAFDWLQAPSADVLAEYERLRVRIQQAVPPDFQYDNVDNPRWRKEMFLALIRHGHEEGAEEIVQGLSPEFFLQIEWLPGGRMEEGELIFDPIFEEAEEQPSGSELRRLCEPNARGFIFNFIREFGDVEYVNIGRLVTSLSIRPATSGRRDVYIAEVKETGSERPFVRILRMQKWGIREHLEEHKDLLRSIIESEEYTEYILDRRLGCRQLGMNLPRRITTRRIGERYYGPRTDLHGQIIWATYIERDYVQGLATEKIPAARFTDCEYATRFAALLGRAAAPNIIVGRTDLDGRIRFDDGDEVLVECERHMPVEIIVTDPSGTFADYEYPLAAVAESYAAPINSRLSAVPCQSAFVDAYIAAFTERFTAIQDGYRKRRPAFDTLFQHRKNEPASFAWRWTRILERLDRTDGEALAKTIRGFIRLPCPAA